VTGATKRALIIYFHFQQETSIQSGSLRGSMDDADLRDGHSENQNLPE
jgi:hypothetical protein